MNAKALALTAIILNHSNNCSAAINGFVQTALNRPGFAGDRLV
jgi:hypothetical protein